MFSFRNWMKSLFRRDGEKTDEPVLQEEMEELRELPSEEGLVCIRDLCRQKDCSKCFYGTSSGCRMSGIPSSWPLRSAGFNEEKECYDKIPVNYAKELNQVAEFCSLDSDGLIRQDCSGCPYSSPHGCNLTGAPRNWILGS